EHGGLAGCTEPIAINQRMAGGGNHFDILDAGAREAGGYKLRGFADINRVVGKRADAGDAKELLQFFEEAILMGFNVGLSGSCLRHPPLCTEWGRSPTCHGCFPVTGSWISCHPRARSPRPLRRRLPLR